MTKYKEYYQRMINDNKEAFEAFTKLHFDYSLDPDGNQNRFNREGERILQIIREWEGKLCHTQEKTYSQYAGGLADKFWGEVRLHFPKIDAIGIISNPKPARSDSEFNLKKITLN